MSLTTKCPQDGVSHLVLLCFLSLSLGLAQQIAVGDPALNFRGGGHKYANCIIIPNNCGAEAANT